MEYDFTSLIDRRGKDALAVDALGSGTGSAPDRPADPGLDAIPMWVADMNFAACPVIPQALIRRASHPLYGYFDPSEEYYGAILSWQARRNGVEGLAKEHIGYENGVLGGVTSALRVLCAPGDAVLLHTPAYIGFTHCLEENGYRAVHSPLARDGEGVWRMDLADMERRIVEHHIHAAIFCSPHNPSGRVWERPELEQAMALFEKHGVYVISDEIWSDLTRPGVAHIPTQSVSPWARTHTVALYAPSKTFNLAGLVGSYHIIYDQWLRERVEKQGRASFYNEMNVMSMHALTAAYGPEGEAWCDQLRAVLAGNVDYAVDYITVHFDGVEAARPQGTYMLFADCGRWCQSHGRTMDELLKLCWDAGVALQDGRAFYGPTHLRINLALPLSRVREAFKRLDKRVFNA